MLTSTMGTMRLTFITLFVFAILVDSQNKEWLSDVNITGLLENSGCKAFASLIASMDIVQLYQTSTVHGLTIFAPLDEAFNAQIFQALSQLTNAQVVSLLEYHALNSYMPITSLKATVAPISTLATNGAGEYKLGVTMTGDKISVTTGLDSSLITNMIIDSMPLCIFTIDNVLLPTELFGKVPSPSPSPPTFPSPSPSPSPSPAPSPSVMMTIKALLEKAGCKTFASMIASTGVLEVFQMVVMNNKGLTIFAPIDKVFSDKALEGLNQLTNVEMLSLLQYHALASYKTFFKLADSIDPISTLATNAAGKFELNVTKNSDKVNLLTGFDFAHIESVVTDVMPLSIFTIDNMLLPTEFLEKLKFPAPYDVNITALLERGGCKTFASLIVSTGVLRVYQTVLGQGLTIFAPVDEAFTAQNLPNLSNLTTAQVVSLLQYHALPTYAPIQTLRTSKDAAISTLATSNAEKYELTITTTDTNLTLKTGIYSAQITKTLIDLNPLIIFTIDTLLLSPVLLGRVPESVMLPSPPPPPPPALPYYNGF